MENGKTDLAGKILIVVFFTLFCNLFFFQRFGSFAFVLLSLAFYVLLLTLFLAKKYWQEAKLTVVGLTAVNIVVLILLATRAPDFVNTVLTLFTLGLLLVFTYLASTKIAFLRSITEFIFMFFRSMIAYLQGSFSALNYLLAKKEGKNLQSFHLRSLIIGVVIAIPIILILISIFSSADPIYGSFAKKIINLEFLRKLLSGQIFQRLFFSLLIFAIFLPLVFFKIKSNFSSPINKLNRFSLVHELEVVMVLVAVTILSFLIIQWEYIFVSVPSEVDLSQFGVATYSEYVQKGFGELLMAAIFIYTLVWGGLIVLRSKRKEQKTILPYVQMAVLLELLLFIISVFRRIVLYQNFHGLSLVRIYGALFLVWLIGLIITLAMRHLQKRSYILAEAIFTAVIVLFIGFFNAEDFIVRVSPPTVNNRVDHVYLSKMSSDGLAGWQKALTYAENTFDHLENKTFLNRDERREILYAGYAARKVLVNYHDLIHQFGNKEEVINYYKKTITSEFKIRDDFLNIWQKQKMSSESAVFLVNRISSLKSEKESAEIILKKLAVGETDSFCMSPEYVSLTVGFWGEFERISRLEILKDLDKYKDYKRCAAYIYYSNPSKRLTGLDKLFAFNVSSEKAFHYLQNDFGLERLLTLQMKYLRFYKKIADQPEGERDIEIDISTRTPFLD